jgi:hypothetical protein
MAGVLDIRGVKQFFFDKELVLNAVDKAARRSLSRGGSYIRTTAKQSLRYKPVKADSPSGQPPFVHRSERFTRTVTNKKTGVTKTRATSPLKELVFFAYDPQRKSVVTGPAVFQQSKTKKYRVPGVLEEGGSVTVRRKGRAVFYSRRIKIAPHPYMRPALAKNLPKIVKGFRASVNTG